MKLLSSAFFDGGSIPALYTCEGANVNPPLEFQDVPVTAKSLVLIMEDPDVPLSIRKDRLWIHWVVYNAPPETEFIKENSQPKGIQGKGTGGKCLYQGPCPPDGEHRYFFTLYAIDILLPPLPGMEKEVEEKMRDHIIEKAVLMGLYRRELKN